MSGMSDANAKVRLTLKAWGINFIKLVSDGKGVLEGS